MIRRIQSTCIPLIWLLIIQEITCSTTLKAGLVLGDAQQQSPAKAGEEEEW